MLVKQAIWCFDPGPLSRSEVLIMVLVPALDCQHTTVKASNNIQHHSPPTLQDPGTMHAGVQGAVFGVGSHSRRRRREPGGDEMGRAGKPRSAQKRWEWKLGSTAGQSWGEEEEAGNKKRARPIDGPIVNGSGRCSGTSLVQGGYPSGGKLDYRW